LLYRVLLFCGPYFFLLGLVFVLFFLLGLVFLLFFLAFIRLFVAV
jgi:hypothetical protein